MATKTKATTHTPGPWRHDATWGLIVRGQTQICALHSGNHANARLIAASPDLLGTLETLIESLDEGVDTQDLLNYINTQCRNVVTLAKAST